MLEYMKEFWKRSNKEGLDGSLTKKQQKKYRKQTIGILIYTGLIMLVYLAGTIELITLQPGPFTLLALIILFLRGFMNTTMESNEELRLIEERITRRMKKNKKKTKKE